MAKKSQTLYINHGANKRYHFQGNLLDLLGKKNKESN